MNTAQIDLQQLRIKYILYKSKVRSALYGGSYDPDFFSPSSPVNSWFNTIGIERYGTEPELRELISIQNEMNAKVKYLTELYKSGKIDQAYGGLPVIEAQSDRFLQLLDKLEKRLGV